MPSSSSSVSLPPLPKPSRSIIGPLTTAFTPPSECQEDCYVYEKNEKSDEGHLICTVYEADCDGSRKCLPGNRASAATDNWWGFYSPGFRCPEGWKTWTTISYGQTDRYTASTVLDLLEPGETALFCCPSHYEFFMGETIQAKPSRTFPPQCLSKKTSRLDEYFTYTECGADGRYLVTSTNLDPLYTTYVTTVDDDGTIETETDVLDYGAFGWGGYHSAPAMKLLWKPSDLEKMSSASATGSAILPGDSGSMTVLASNSNPTLSSPQTTATNGTGTDFTGSQSNHSTSSNSDSTTPPIGVIVGAAAGSVVVAIVGIGLLVFCYMRRWKKKSSHNTPGGDGNPWAADNVQQPNNINTVSPLTPGNDDGKGWIKPELSTDQQINELHNETFQPELPGDYSPSPLATATTNSLVQHQTRYIPAFELPVTGSGYVQGV